MTVRKKYKPGVTNHSERNTSEFEKMKAKTAAFVSLMAALANVISLPPFAIPVPVGTFTSSVHFFQLAVFLAALLAGHWAGLLSGAVGSLYMSATRLPFIVGGIALLGASTGFFAKRFRSVTACMLAFLVQLPYTLTMDFLWFTYFLGNTPATAISIVTPIMLSLGLEALVCAVLADIIVQYLRKASISF